MKNQKPKGSERTAKRWLEHIGVHHLKYTGESSNDGPPDFVFEFKGDYVAAEVCLLPDTQGWDRDVEIAVCRCMQELVAETAQVKGAPHWYSRIEYDVREPRGSMKDKSWIDRARREMLKDGPGGRFQLLSPKVIKGRGVVLELTPASGKGGFMGVSRDAGIMVTDVLLRHVLEGISDKKENVLNGTRAKNYKTWWLIMDDDILFAPISALSEDERGLISQSLKNNHDTHFWSKAILVNRFQSEETPDLPPPRHHVLWESVNHPALRE